MLFGIVVDNYTMTSTNWVANRFVPNTRTIQQNDTHVRPIRANRRTRSAVESIVSKDEHERHAWALLQAARELADDFPGRQGIHAMGSPATNKVTGSASSRASVTTTASHLHDACSFHYMPGKNTVRCQPGVLPGADLVYESSRWKPGPHVPERVRQDLELYLPLLGSHEEPEVVTGHLGQSIDSRIATVDGDAFFVTGDENRKHLHRLRSLSQAVVVGAGTVMADDPQLTTRAVSGRNPVRVIIDPQARVPDNLAMLSDRQAPVWLLHGNSVDIDCLPAVDGVRRLTVPINDGSLQPPDILATLAANGLHRIFVEGGGVTVSRFFNARCLSRLQIAVAPVLVGQGIPALQLPAAPSMREAIRPNYRLYRMGDDILWDFELHDTHWTCSGDSLPLTSSLSTQSSSAEDPMPLLQRLF